MLSCLARATMTLLLSIQTSFYIHHFPPFVARIVNCSCHRPGVLEIKCLFHCKEASFKEAATQASVCLEEDNDSFEDHTYYYQVQLQMKMSGRLC